MSFSFGRNWRSFSRFVSNATIKEAQADIVNWLGADGVLGKSVIDLGCGSGIHSLGFYNLGAQSIVSLDVDRNSVACTRLFWERAAKPPSWRVEEGDILNLNAVAALGQYDIVYSWGVLHHTGQLWTAIENASKLGKPVSSRLWISLYTKGPNYSKHLKQKQCFNNASWASKHATVLLYLLRRWRSERLRGRKFSSWFWHGRGMNAYHNAFDWFGGMPYEVASVDEVVFFLSKRGWNLERLKPAIEGGCTVYLFRRSRSAPLVIQ
jgi:2-polyprenyl-6-hydroxyphenyl methylase/3-demethylubiquinone-9 3-methyltransferase